MRVEFSPYVEGDLDEIAAYIAGDDPRRAVSFIQQIRAEIERIATARSTTNYDRKSAKMPAWP